METINVLVAKPFPDHLIEKIANASPHVSVTKHPAEGPEDLPETIRETHVLYTSRALPDPAEAPELKWVQLHSAGVDHILNHPLYRETEVCFTTTSGIHAIQIAEYTLAQMLAFAHHLPRMLKDKQDKVWTPDRWARYVPVELYGSTLGIIGYGSIGRQIARLGHAFGMKVLALKRNVRNLIDQDYTMPDIGDPEGDIPDRIYPPAALHSFLKECDYVVAALPMNSQTHHLIDEAALAVMKSEAVLINTSRGGVVDEAALIEALKANKIKGAALDVFEQEPLPEDSPLWTLPNVLISPHVSGFTPQYDERATDLFTENLRRFAAGERLLNLVDRAIDY